MIVHGTAMRHICRLWGKSVLTYCMGAGSNQESSLLWAERYPHQNPVVQDYQAWQFKARACLPTVSQVSSRVVCFCKHNAHTYANNLSLAVNVKVHSHIYILTSLLRCQFDHFMVAAPMQAFFTHWRPTQHASTSAWCFRHYMSETF